MLKVSNDAKGKSQSFEAIVTVDGGSEGAGYAMDVEVLGWGADAEEATRNARKRLIELRDRLTAEIESIAV